MANTSLVRALTFAQKKSECFFAAPVNEGTETYEIPAITGNYLLANLPPEAIITNAYIHVVAAGDAGTSSTGKLGTAETGSQILSAANMKTLGKQGTFTGQVETGSGVELHFTITNVGTAATAVGKYIIVVEYLEYSKKTGEYTKF